MGRWALIIIWIVTTITMIFLLSSGVRNMDGLSVLYYVLPGIYVFILAWYLWRTGPLMEGLPEIPPPVIPKWRFVSLIPVLLTALVFLLHFSSDSGGSILLLLLIIATGWILVSWRRQITLHMVVIGCALTIVAFLGGWLYFRHAFISSTAFFLFLILVLPMVIAGGLLIKHSGLSNVQLLAGSYGRALKGFLWGCLLFVPLGLTNAASGSPDGDFQWLTRLWMPFSLPWFSGIAEEVLYRLVLVSLCYLMLRPVLPKQPKVAVMGAVVFSAITFGLGHGRTVHNFLTTGLLYGLPMALLFAERDWEHAVGAHYMVNFIPVLTVFLEKHG